MVEAIYNIEPSTLKRRGISAVLTDLDNTLIAWNNPKGTPQLQEWLHRMAEAGITVMVVSNNNHDRVKKAVGHMEVQFTARALKPLPVGIDRAVRTLGIAKSACIMVGDQMLTDMIAGNLAGVKTVLVKPLIKTDQWNTLPNRFIEGFIKGHMKRKGTFKYQEDIDD
ncbi:hydrolase, HAD-super, subfamily IIIA domain protein [Lacticaseibacillus sharpeae JCM 1186 = DSM 20505]|uniref:Hydrolase, HAD-super, subfamily IIIA domain protein n=2 Tax=Lacticaseibacillus sharpeae TaxID=1626 RepID=A0A0R1ZMT4_9LACO|nr:hydrolase, HAD-super, subfamily IIIA domain protein [Lacticaseibacillus sharpeae JCM 1186 = DSM 20505]